MHYTKLVYRRRALTEESMLFLMESYHLLAVE